MSPRGTDARTQDVTSALKTARRSIGKHCIFVRTFVDVCLYAYMCARVSAFVSESVFLSANVLVPDLLCSLVFVSSVIDLSLCMYMYVYMCMCSLHLRR